jgi:hypothetical protein
METHVFLSQTELGEAKVNIMHKQTFKRLVSAVLLISLTFSPLLTSIALGAPLYTETGDSLNAVDGVDLRQSGSIEVSGTLVEGSKVYLTIPIKNYGSSASPPIHPYTEGYTALGDLWRADGAQPTAVVIQPGETVNFQVEHDLWSGHIGVWSTYGVYLWDDSSQTYYGSLNANGYNQQVTFKVTLDIRQVGPIQISGSLVEGGKVYLTIPVKNFSGTATPAMHIYSEGRTALGDLWRADGAQPTAVVIQPGETVSFQIEHDLWEGHVGTWSTESVHIWNDAANDYYGPVIANGYNQQVSFDVVATVDVRQAGPVEIRGTLYQGHKVYLEIPVKNFGGVATPPMHVYTEGYTALGDLWRADGAQPTATILDPGETVNFQVEHDLWYEHVGTWSTYGVYIWNDEVNTYESPLAANGYNQEVSFDVGDTPLSSLEIEYLDDSNKAFDVHYEVVDQLVDGSLLVDLTIRNKTKIPYFWKTIYWGGVEDGGGSLERFSQAGELPMLPETSKTFHNVRFSRDGHLEFHFPMFGYDDEDLKFVGALHAIEILAIAVLGFIPTGDMFESYENLVAGELDLFIDQIENINLDWAMFGYNLSRGKFKEAFESLAGIGEDYVAALSKASGAILKSPLSEAAIKKALKVVAYILRFIPAIEYLWDLKRSPGFAQVTITPSSRPSTRNLVHSSSNPPLEPEIIWPDATIDQAKQVNLASAQIGGSVVASSSEQSEKWSQEDIIDGEISTGWATGGTTANGEWIVIELAEDTPALIQSVEINPGPTQGDHHGAALKAFHVDVSMDGTNFDTALQESFAPSEIGQTQAFPISPIKGRYVRLVIDSNQSDNAVTYANVAEVRVIGSAFYSDDYYEPDSSQQFATWNDTGGVAQLHNFSYPGDADWHRIQSVAGQKYLISTTPMNNDTSMAIEVFASDGTTLLQAHEAPAGESAYLIWQALESEDIYVRVSNTDEQDYGTDTDYRFSVINATNRTFLPIVIRNAP